MSRTQQSPSKTSQNTKKKYDRFDTYIYKVLKQVHPDTGINSAAMQEMDQFVKAAIEIITGAANQLSINSNRKTLDEKTIKSAVKLTLPGELGKHAQDEGAKAVAKFKSSKIKSPSSKREPVSKSFRSGLVFSVPRVAAMMADLSLAQRKSSMAAVYLTSVIEYLVAEILELAGNSARDNKRVRITPRNIKLSILNDAELDEFTKNMILPGGVEIQIHYTLIPKRKEKGMKST